MRTDPSENGGLFLGRRPGTTPVRYGRLPQRGSPGRVTLDRIIAAAMLVLMVVLTALLWGPMPVGAMWLSSQIASSNAGLWLVVAFVLVLVVVFGSLMLLRRIDQAWILVRRASGVDQRTGILSRVFLITTLIVIPIFGFWFAFLGGMRPTVGGM